MDTSSKKVRTQSVADQLIECAPPVASSVAAIEGQLPSLSISSYSAEPESSAAGDAKVSPASAPKISKAERPKQNDVVPFLDLPQQFRALQPEINAALARIFSTAGFILGPDVKEFEKSFADYLGARECVTLHSGTAALHLALLALGIGPGDEVITAANSFVATAEGIAFTGATTRLVDVDPVTYNLDPGKLEAAITPRTKAIIPVHLYGQPANMEAIMKIARVHGVKVVEDACQAHGARYKGQRVGTIGDIGCFSFYPGKNLGAAGEGGAIVTNNPELAEQVRLLRDHGSRKKYEHEIVGHNFRLDTVQAAVLNIKLKHLDKWNKARMAKAARYAQLLSGLEQIVLPATAVDCEHVFHLYAIQTGNRAELQAKLNAKNIQSGIHYPTPIHLQKAFEYLGYKAGDFPVSESLCNTVLSLPMFAELTDAQQDRVVAALKEALS